MIKCNFTEFEVIKFSAGEPHVKLLKKRIDIDEPSPQITWDFENFEEFSIVAFLCDIANYQGVLPELYIPYFPFARQDRATSIEQPFSLKVFIRMLSTLKIKAISSCDLHSKICAELLEAYNIKFYQFSQVSCARDTIPTSVKYNCVIAPDKGAVEKAAKIAENYNVPLVTATKQRDPVTGKLSNPEIDFGNVIPKYCLIPDDICDHGGTFIQLADEIHKQYPEAVLDLYVTHGIFAAGTEELEKRFRKIYCYNNIANKRKKEK